MKKTTKGDSLITGKRGEYKVIGKLMEKGFLVYVPVVDVEGVDCIVKNRNGRLIQIQIKTRNKNEEDIAKNFVVKNLKEHRDFFICCYFINTDDLWVIPSFVFRKESIANAKGHSVLSMSGNKEYKLAHYKDDLGIGLLRRD